MRRGHKTKLFSKLHGNEEIWSQMGLGKVITPPPLRTLYLLAVQYRSDIARYLHMSWPK